MKTLAIITTTALLMGGSVRAGTLSPADVDAEAKWLAHLDMEAFQRSTIGAYAVKQIRQRMEEENESPIGIDVDMALSEIHSVTAYGSEFKDRPEERSALVMRTGNRARAIIDGFIANAEATAEGEPPVKPVVGSDLSAYELEGGVFFAFAQDNVLIASKSFAQLLRANAILEGEAASLAQSDSELLQAEPEGFFFVASVNELDTLDGVPPQARILQKATGGQLSIGEVGAMLRSNLVLATQDNQVADQLYRIVQGMIALASFAEVEDESFALLTENLAVSKGDRQVSIDFVMEAQRFIDFIEPIVAERAKSDADGQEGKGSEEPEGEDYVDDAVGGERLRVANVDAKSDNGNLPRNATDADPESYWGSNGRGQWIRFELESFSLVREVQVAWHEGDRRQHRFAVEISPNGVNWERLIALRSSGTTAGLESYNIPDVATQWIRLVCDGNTESDANAIADIRFLGEASYELPETVAGGGGV